MTINVNRSQDRRTSSWRQWGLWDLWKAEMHQLKPNSTLTLWQKTSNRIFPQSYEIWAHNPQLKLNSPPDLKVLEKGWNCRKLQHQARKCTQIQMESLGALVWNLSSQKQLSVIHSQKRCVPFNRLNKNQRGSLFWNHSFEARCY